MFLLTSKYRKTIGILAISMLSAPFANATELLLDVRVGIGGGDPQRQTVQVTTQSESEILVESPYRLLVTPTLLEGDRVHLAFRFIEKNAEAEHLIGKPALDTELGRTAIVEIGSNPPSKQNLYLEVVSRAL